MRKNLFIIAAFVIQFFALRYVYFQSGWNQALATAQQEFYNGPEGYCLADLPPHPGECHEKDPNGKRH